LTYSVRPMRKEDLPQVMEIDREAFPTQWPPPNYRQELQNHIARYIVVCDDSKTQSEPEVKPAKGLAGLFSRLKRYFHHPSTGKVTPARREYIAGFAGIWVLSKEAHITNIAVRQKYQRRGLGEQLLLTTIDLAQEMKASGMTLEVRASNTAAQNLYRKYGFTQTGIRRGYYLDNREDGIIMSTEDISSASFQARLQPLREAVSRKLNVVQ
jgi:ribosomal-protein-alanine N-acetyltransferase